MGGRKRAPVWRAGFLRALGRSGNVREAAERAGVDHSTVYGLRRRDPGFGAAMEAARARWREAAAAALAAGRSPLRTGGRGRGRGAGASAGSGAGSEAGLILRISAREGPQLVRAASERWSGRAEHIFLDALRATANVRRAALAADQSTTALYRRREKYPDFAARWDAAIEEAKARLHALVVGAGLASLDPGGADEADGEAEAALPAVTVGEAIAILRLKGTGAGAGAGGGGGGGARARTMLPEPPIEQVRATILARLDANEAAEKRGG